jgi:hypothetical protein
MTPTDLGSNGTRLWRSVADECALDVHEVLLLLQACRCADRLNQLAVAGWASWVVAEPVEHDDVAGVVGVAVTASVESVSVDAAAAGRDRGVTQPAVMTVTGTWNLRST